MSTRLKHAYEEPLVQKKVRAEEVETQPKLAVEPTTGMITAQPTVAPAFDLFEYTRRTNGIVYTCRSMGLRHDIQYKVHLTEGCYRATLAIPINEIKSRVIPCAFCFGASGPAATASFPEVVWPKMDANTSLLPRTLSDNCGLSKGLHKLIII
jgi:hypothetical protein